MSEWPLEVILILDPCFGKEIYSLPPGILAWIIMSAENEPLIREWWAKNQGCDYEHGITGFHETPGAEPEAYFSTQLLNIEQHHGPHGETPSFTALRVMGMPLTRTARYELSELGFSEFTEVEEGFSATRAVIAAEKRR